MAKKSGGNMLGSWAFLIGVILAVIFGVLSKGASLNQGLVYILVVIGLIVGLLNIAANEVSAFLMAGTILVIVSTLGQTVVQSVPLFESILNALAILFVPATIIVALKHVFGLARH